MKWIFKFYDDSGKTHWENPLYTQNCVVCCNSTSLVHPYCLECLPRMFKVSIKTSLLGPEVGKGLFATDFSQKNGQVVFTTGDFICPYLGEFLSREDLRRRYCDGAKNLSVKYVTAPYAFNNGVDFIDGSIYRGPAVYTNDVKGSPYKNNSILRMDDEDKNLNLYAIKKIKNGEEIFTKYGDFYWQGYHLPYETVLE